MMADDQDDQAPDDDQAEWVLARWVVRYGVELMAVRSYKDRPCPQSGCAADTFTWHRWNSYHAARKYQRSHPSLTGYMVCNLSAITAASRAADAAKEKVVQQEA